MQWKHLLPQFKSYKILISTSTHTYKQIHHAATSFEWNEYIHNQPYDAMHSHRVQTRARFCEAFNFIIEALDEFSKSISSQFESDLKSHDNSITRSHS